MRLLMTADAVGGVWTYALDLAGALAPLGVTTALAVLGPPPAADQQAQAAAVPGLSLRQTGLPLDWLATKPEAVFAAGAALAALARAEGVDLLHLNSPALAAGQAGGFGCPVVATCHSCLATWWEAVRGGPLPADFTWRTALLRQGYAAADALTAPSHAFAEATARCYGLARPPAVVRNGRPPSRPAAPPAGAPARFALTAGRLWDAGKNLDTLDRAAARLSWPVLAAGPLRGPEGSEAAPRHVRPLGRLDATALSAWMGAAPVFVSLARYEPFGLAVLEAAQAGCALVLADIPSFRELWEGAALLVPATEAGRAAEALAHLLDDPAASARMGALARERARRYSADAMAAGMLGIIQPLLARSGPRREAAFA
ncbi:glycosyltransferase family 4 protein [Roseicella sp. DB1501]|uniref:glycosyltransferase family 4 protein n=1 Tax=Roseicella sp. DB1501 TaxID=2730925 RepID=UPI0020C3D0CF|nr:glycosyltransferase family 4 protein [Roseicella sp. DB1501]